MASGGRKEIQDLQPSPLEKVTEFELGRRSGMKEATEIVDSVLSVVEDPKMAQILHNLVAILAEMSSTNLGRSD